MKNAFIAIFILVLLLILPRNGCPQYTQWRVEHTVEMAKAEKKAKDILDAQKPRVNRCISVGSEWTENLYKGLPQGTRPLFVPIGSPGVAMLALVNESKVVSWNTSTDAQVLRGKFRGGSVRFKVDQRHHPHSVVTIEIFVPE